ncbi:MAG: hypothetical protein AAFU84_07305 [Cyanobacteria bacterium J06633_23]
MSFLKILFNPIFLLAAGLHAGLLMIPVAGGSSDDIVPAPDPEGESITVTRIPPAQPQGGGATRSASRPNQTNSTPKAPASSNSSGQSAGSGSKAKSGSQGGQSSGSGNTGADSNGSTEESSAPAGGLPPLPPSGDSSPAGPTAGSDNGGSTPVEVTPSSEAATPPTLIALKEGVQDRGVPKLLRDFLALFNHSVLQTTDEELEESKRLWLAELDQSGPRVSVSKELEIPLNISYPLTVDDNNGPRQLRSCLDPLPAKGVMGVIVDADGELATEPTLLRSSGYEVLNNVALAKIKDYTDFPDEGSHQAYTIDIDVDYDKDACLDLTNLKK